MYLCSVTNRSILRFLLLSLTLVTLINAKYQHHDQLNTNVIGLFENVLFQNVGLDLNCGIDSDSDVCVQPVVDDDVQRMF